MAEEQVIRDKWYLVKDGDGKLRICYVEVWVIREQGGYSRSGNYKLDFLGADAERQFVNTAQSMPNGTMMEIEFTEGDRTSAS